MSQTVSTHMSPAKLVRATFIGLVVGVLLYLVFYLAFVFINTVGGAAVLDPAMAGLLGLVLGFSSALGVEYAAYLG